MRACAPARALPLARLVFGRPREGAKQRSRVSFSSNRLICAFLWEAVLSRLPRKRVSVLGGFSRTGARFFLVYWSIRPT